MNRRNYDWNRRARLIVLTAVGAGGLALLLIGRGSQSDDLSKILRDRTKSGETPKVSDKTPNVGGAESTAPGATIGGSSVDKRATTPIKGPWRYTRKRLVLSAQGSHEISYFFINRVGGSRGAVDGEIWLTISQEDGRPFVVPDDAEISIQRLTATTGDYLKESLDRDRSKPADGLWHFTLPKLQHGNYFYRIKLMVEDAVKETTYEGQTVVNASHNRIPYWNSQRPDGTIWYPPK